MKHIYLLALHLSISCLMANGQITKQSGIPQDTIVFMQDEGRDDVHQYFLEKQGYVVISVQTTGLADASPGFKDTLNNADLVIIGISNHRSNFINEHAVAWKAVTAPVVLTDPFIARRVRINWFESSNAYHRNIDPDTAYAQITNPNDTIFSFVDFTDSIPWMIVHHDLLSLHDSATNGTKKATFRGTDALIVQNAGGIPLYEDGPVPVGPRTYFGFGNEDMGFENFFPLTEQAQQVYFNELQRLIGRPMKQVAPIWPTEQPATVVFVQWNGMEARQQEFLETNRFEVIVLEQELLSTADQSYINTLNNADLVIIGVSPQSAAYRNENAAAWKNITSPVIVNDPWIVRNPIGINWFEAASLHHKNTEPKVAYASVSNPGDNIFHLVEFLDSIPWSFAPHDFVYLDDTATNGNIVAKWQETSALIVQNEAGIPLYEGGPTAAAPRTYFGFGNDNTGFVNFFPLTPFAQQVYYNEILRLLDKPMREVITVEPTTPEGYKAVNVMATPVEGGIITGHGIYAEDSTVIVEAAPYENYEFVKWTEDGTQVSTDSSYSFSMGIQSRTLTAHFGFTADLYTLSLEAAPIDGGNVTGEGVFIEGESVTIEATPNEQYEFLNWTDNDTIVSTDTSYSFNMRPDNRTITANFNILPVYYTVSLHAEPDEGGTVTGDGEYEEGELVAVSAIANDGYAFVNWRYENSGISSNASYEFTLGSEDITLTAHFKEDNSVNIETSHISNIRLYPNPAHSKITIRGLTQNANIRVLNVTGQAIATFRDVRNGEQLDVSHLANGLYIVSIEAEGQVIKNMRLIK